MPGAFRKSLDLRGRHRIKMLFQHDPKDPIGTWDSDRARTASASGSRAGWCREVPRAEALRRLIARGAVDGLSIGFRTVKATRDAPRGHRKLWEIDLWEISIVTFPMMDLARIAPGKPPGRKARLDRSLEAAISAVQAVRTDHD